MTEPNFNPGNSPNASMEKLFLWWDGMKRWFSQAAKLGLMMAKGAYLLGERQRLLAKLGEKVYDQIKAGTLSQEELKPLVENLERLTESIEHEEKRIQDLRNSGLDGDETPASPPPV
jgi:hypothetical protein